MKLVIFLFMLTSGILPAQKFNLKSLDSLSFNSQSDQIVGSTQKSLKETDRGTLSNSWQKYIKYQNSSSPDERFYILYFTKERSEQGRKVRAWTIESLAGDFQTIFDFYKKHFNHTANADRIKKMGQDYDSKNTEASIRKTSQEGLWEIRFW